MSFRLRTFLLCAALAPAACGRDIRVDTRELSAAPAPPLAARVTSAVADTAGATISTVLYSEHEADTRSRIGGVVQSVAVELGDPVHAGEVMVRLRDDREAALVASARAALDLARAQHARIQAMKDRELATQAELDSAVYLLRSGEAGLRDAEAQLEYTRIRAPFDGVVAHRYVRLGQSVKPDDPLVRVTAPRPLRAQLLVPELQANRVAVGERVPLRGLDGATASATVARVAPVVDPVSGTVELLLQVSDPGGLRPGSAVTAELPPVRGAGRPPVAGSGTAAGSPSAGVSPRARTGSGR